MKKLVVILVLVNVLLSGAALAKKGGKNDYCTTIPSGELYYPEGRYLAGEPLKPGFDIFGYNYLSHMFLGYYANVYLNGYGFPPYDGDDNAYYQRLVDEGYADNVGVAEDLMNGFWFWHYRDTWLMMKWNDAWLSNKDCDGDGILDRHYGYDSYIGSGAWLTNHMWGTYEMDGKTCSWYWFEKIVAVPENAYLENGFWYTADGKEIGPAIWGQFAVIQSIYNDPCAGAYGAEYISKASAGFGYYR